VHLIRHLQTLSPEFFSRSRLGDVLSRLSGDVSAIEGFIVSGSTDLVYKVLQLVFFVGALFLLQWQLALVSLIVCPLFWVTARFFSRRIKEISREKQRRSGAITSVAEQILSNISLVQAYGRSSMRPSGTTRRWRASTGRRFAPRSCAACTRRSST